MQKLILGDGPNSALLTVNKEAGLISLAMGGDNPDRVRVEIDYRKLSISLFNSSDLGLTCDNNGLTTIHQLAVEGSVEFATQAGVGGGAQLGIDGVGPWIASSTGSGKRFRLVVDDSGNLQLPLPLIVPPT